MIAGDRASHAAVVFVDFRKARRLTATVFMVFPLARVYSPRLYVHGGSLAIGRKCMIKQKPRARHVVWRRRCRGANSAGWVLPASRPARSTGGDRCPRDERWRKKRVKNP